MFVKKMFVLSCAVFLATAFAAGAAQDTLAQDTKQASPDLKSGTIKRLDPVAKTATVQATTKDGAPLSGPDAKESVVCWDEATKIEGGPMKEGDLVHFKTAAKSGKTCATLIQVGKADKPKPDLPK
jgi:hypothetical protein